MELTRRTFLHGAGAGLALAVTGAARTGWTATTLNLGSAELTTLSDGYLVQPRNFVLGGMPEAEYMPILRRHGLSPEEFRPECNVTLFRDGDRVVLFDAGSGSGFLPTVGTLPEAMDAIGLNPEDVTHVVFTHGHADHLWGVLDDFDEPFFPNAKHMMGRVEFDYWFDPDTVNRIAPTRTNMAVGAKRRLDLLADRITLFDDGEEILPNVAARMTPGHTPGHMSFEIRGGSESVMILGDAVTNHHINFERPEMGSAVDQDRQMGADTRVLLLDQIAHAQMGVIGFHLPQGGIGRVERLGDAYRYVPETG
ncbi:MBL fold metallo-hydrolase [Jhaorihella thermophila]|uniref:Glyoxylase, beta-lactamase superfamily II n=1 Tax=Jhaorihella thermophila TaxID=488547 RepID=A0A1H5XKD2_9RHOB|nr:MBL fold metallo-hydrolase [Jhaorihella thermophila]SEG12234.1 Glyoxylase, beta-lactamase superfamily II [Jhaorihella thermophila]